MLCKRFQDYVEGILIQERIKLFSTLLECKRTISKIQDTPKMYSKNSVA
jgi:hypothetical protein